MGEIYCMFYRSRALRREGTEFGLRAMWARFTAFSIGVARARGRREERRGDVGEGAVLEI